MRARTHTLQVPDRVAAYFSERQLSEITAMTVIYELLQFGVCAFRDADSARRAYCELRLPMADQPVVAQAGTLTEAAVQCLHMTLTLCDSWHDRQIAGLKRLLASEVA